ncbi:MAG TPA: hypothetical protein PKO09_10450 [Anaerolineae bacterium]|nr:hypothetical protein [Anaerolineae bacterium]
MVDLLARSSFGPQPMELWFEKATRGIMAVLRRAGQSDVRPSHAVVVHIEEIWKLAPGLSQEVWQ